MANIKKPTLFGSPSYCLGNLPFFNSFKKLARQDKLMALSANSERFFVTTSRDQVSAKSFSAIQRAALLLAILNFKYSES